ncbi:MAG: histidine phosphatase family protein [Myxococcales bacterium]|nr:histidine phosphatase family protein [Myxococcales bacterium]
MGQVLLIRHGQAGFGTANYDQLSEAGHRQARITGAAWRGCVAIDQVISGTMRRHKETAAGFAETFGTLPDARLDAGFDEFDHEGVLRAQYPDLRHPSAIRAWLKQQPDPKGAFRDAFNVAISHWVAGDSTRPYTETFAQFVARTTAALDRLGAALGERESAVVFTSGGVISALALSIVGLPGSDLFKFTLELTNGSVTRLRRADGEWRLGSFNEHAHLLGHEPPALTRL